MIHYPASPPPTTPDDSGGGGGGADVPGSDLHDEDVDLSLALPNDPIVGVEHVLRDEQGPGAREARPLPSPPSMTPAQKAKHDLTHLPPHLGCAICRSTRSPNLQHGPSHEHERIIPLLVGAYCFLRRADESSLLTCLVMRLYPTESS